MGDSLTGWFVDPLGKFDGRYFDGVVWTNQVSSAGQLCHDPDWSGPDQPSASSEHDSARSVGEDMTPNTTASAQPAPYEPSRSGERRQVNLKVDVDRRRSDRRETAPDEAADTAATRNATAENETVEQAGIVEVHVAPEIDVAEIAASLDLVRT